MQSRSGLAVTAQDVDNLVLDDLLDIGTAVAHILAGIKVIGVSVKVLPDPRGHAQTQIGVNVDLTHRQPGGLTELFTSFVAQAL